MKYALLAAAAAAVVGATPAAAANNFAGPRGELRVGYDKVTLDLTLTDGVDKYSESGHKSGGSLGLDVGYDAPLGDKAIFGGYVGVAGSTAKYCTEIYGDDRYCLDTGRDLTVGGRVGAVLGDTFMVYGKLGYTNGQLREKYRDNLDPTNDFSDHVDRGGMHFGAGIETSIPGVGYGRLEYVRTNYKAYRATEGTTEIKLGGHRDQVLVGMGVRF